MFIDCLLLSKAQTFHILLLSGDKCGSETGHRECIPETPNRLKHLCAGDTPVLATVLKLPCTHFPSPIFLLCPPSCSVVHSPAHPPQANQGDKTQVSLLLAQQSPLYHHCHCFPFVALCDSPGRTTCWPQAHGECLVPCSAPAHRSLWVGLSKSVLLLLVQGL